jgi:hypothetical protein
MTEFLRDLSPHRAHDATRAIALLPSLFEAMHPLRTARVTPEQAEHSKWELSVQGVPFAPIAPVHAAAVASASLDHVAAATADVSAADVSVATPPQSGVMPAPRASDAHRPPAPRIGTPIPRTTTLPRAIQAPQAARGIDPEHPITSEVVAAAAKMVASVSGVPVDAASAPVRTPPAAPRDASSRIVQTPMSARALAFRPAQRSDSRPVVHVTIDRIEVRAPAAQERPKPSPRSRATASSVSLNDYLRAHEPERRGGIS